MFIMDYITERLLVFMAENSCTGQLTQHYRMEEAGRDLWCASDPTSAHTGTLIAGCTGHIKVVSEVPQGGDPRSLGSLYNCCHLHSP